MRTATAQVRAGSRSWLLPVSRAVVAFAIGLVVTFAQDHSASAGLVFFGIFAVATGAAAGLFALTVPDRPTRLFALVSAVASVVCGVAALVAPTGGLAFFLYVVSIWAAVTGVLELVAGLRRRSDPASRDRLVAGGLTMVLALVMLVIPDDSVLAVGLFGAYAVVIGVYLAIGGLSQKWAFRMVQEAPRG